MESKEEPLIMKTENSEKPKISQFMCEICNFEASDQSCLNLHFTSKYGQQYGQSAQIPHQLNKVKREFKKSQESLNS